MKEREDRQFKEKEKTELNVSELLKIAKDIQKEIIEEEKEKARSGMMKVIVEAHHLSQDREIVFHLFYGRGRKKLKVFVEYTTLFPKNYFRTYIENIDNKTQRIQGETTALYTVAKRIIEKYTEKTHQEFHYEFISSIPTMVKWAKTKGRTLFQWDEVMLGKTSIICTKLFKP